MTQPSQGRVRTGRTLGRSCQRHSGRPWPEQGNSSPGGAAARAAKGRGRGSRVGLGFGDGSGLGSPGWVWFLKEVVVPAPDADTQARSAFDAWSHIDFLCRNYILNGLDNTLYSVYSATKTAKELWDSLEKKYKTKDAGTKKFVVEKFLEFKMVDTKTVISQVQDFQIILHDIMAEGVMISESFQVAALIEKLPPLWKEFKNYLKHKRKEMGLEYLIVRLRIEKDNRKAEIKTGKMPMEAKTNLTNHKAKYCRLPKKDNQYRTNVVQHKSVPIDLSEIDLSAVVFETNMVDHPREWYIDTGATRHVCVDKELFSKYTPISGRQLYRIKVQPVQVVR
ncbi:uncharacterized protein [Henckelia pumila]|uniref:uncharacterized protein n=1 Tax=Henckelia pumila TaxID=405737 RepID=UPI003C6E41F3